MYFTLCTNYHKVNELPWVNWNVIKKRVQKDNLIKFSEKELYNYTVCRSAPDSRNIKFSNCIENRGLITETLNYES